jgi:UDP-glucose:(heptosyl)LPS alpha-1,3-glucosyltransferase
MNIALIRQEQTGSDGGAQAIIDLMLQALETKQAVNISLLCRKWESNQHNATKVIIDPPFHGRKNKQSTFNQAVTDYISNHSFDLIQSHERFNGCHIFRAGDGVHKIWLQQKSLISNPLQRWWLKYSPYHKALLAEEKAMFESNTLKKIICNSEMVKKEILNNFSINEEKIAVIYNGVDTNIYTPTTTEKKNALRQTYNIPSDALVFIFSCSGFERKNLSTTLKAFSQLDNTCYLLVVGRDKKQAQYEKLATSLNIRSRALFLGAQEKSTMANLYQTADVLVLPTLYDPFANVILEGLASGLPCITSKHCGAVDVIPQSNCGIIIPPLDCTALIAAMKHYQNSQYLSYESNNAQVIAKRFTQDVMQEKLLTLYNELLQNNNGQP